MYDKINAPHSKKFPQMVEKQKKKKKQTLSKIAFA